MEEITNQQNSAATAMRDLYAQFPQEAERTIVKSGVELVYLPISEVINRLNRVLGVNGWSFEIVEVKRDAVDQDEIVAHVCLTATIADCFVTKHGFGGSQVKRAKSTGKPIDLGNDFKGAVSDALKKAAQQLGIGLYLARSADALDAEFELDAQVNGHQEQQESGPSKDDEQWNVFLDMTKKMTTEQKKELNSFWEKHSNGKPKPTKSNATPEDIQALIAEALRISFGGTYVSEGK